jgi:malonate transporter and related proteins
MYNVFYSVLPIFLIALVGSIIKRKWLTSDEFWRGLEKLSFYILFPAMLFEHTLEVNLNNSEFTRLIIALFIANLLVSIGLVVYQFRTDYDRVQFTSVFQGATRYNSYIFFALGAALFGEDGLKIIATISPYLLILTNVTAIISFAYYIPKSGSNLTIKRGLVIMFKSIVANPFVLASIAGGLFNYFDLILNQGIEKTIHSFSNSSFAIGMLVVGAGMKLKIKPEYLNQIIFTSGVKLIIMPIVTFIILWMMSITGTSKSVGILFSCLPCASSAYILSRQLGGDVDTMSSIVTFSTIFSIISLSLLVYILG